MNKKITDKQRLDWLQKQRGRFYSKIDDEDYFDWQIIGESRSVRRTIDIAILTKLKL